VGNKEARQVGHLFSRSAWPGRGTHATGISTSTVVPAFISLVATKARFLPGRVETFKKLPDSAKAEAIALSRSARRETEDIVGIFSAAGVKD
jgi:hypothetical protein